MTITYKSVSLFEAKDVIPAMAELGFVALGRDKAFTEARLKVLSYKGVRASLAYNGDTLVGCTVWSSTEQFIDWFRHAPEALVLGNRDRMIGTSDLYVHPVFWGEGVHKGLVQERHRDALVHGKTEALIFDVNSDNALAFVKKMKGARVVPGIKDSKGRDVVLINLQENVS